MDSNTELARHIERWPGYEEQSWAERFAELDRRYDGLQDKLFTALTQPAEQIADSAVARWQIEVEKLLCAKLGREWAPTGFSIISLIDDLANAQQARAQALEEAAKVAEGYWVEADYETVGIADADMAMELCRQSASAIRALNGQGGGV